MGRFKLRAELVRSAEVGQRAVECFGVGHPAGQVLGGGVADVLTKFPADVPAQIKLVETQPADMDRSTWKERRRDAARKLGQSKDRRAVAVLIRLAETETFDIIGEIAIEGLGNLGDPAAVPTLQKIAAELNKGAVHPVSTVQIAGMDLLACDWHPSLADHQLMAGLVDKEIQRLGVWN